MNIYAIRDRLINYYQTPFMAHTDKEVLASLAKLINGEDINIHEIAQAPQHYEIWRLGQVDQDGDLIQDKELLADCASLIRIGVRTRHEPTNQVGKTPGQSTSPESRNPSSTAADTRPAQNASQTASGAD